MNTPHHKRNPNPNKGVHYLEKDSNLYGRTLQGVPELLPQSGHTVPRPQNFKHDPTGMV
jgi:hypothetical protein